MLLLIIRLSTPILSNYQTHFQAQKIQFQLKGLECSPFWGNGLELEIASSVLEN